MLLVPSRFYVNSFLSVSLQFMHPSGVKLNVYCSCLSIITDNTNVGVPLRASNSYFSCCYIYTLELVAYQMRVQYYT